MNDYKLGAHIQNAKSMCVKDTMIKYFIFITLIVLMCNLSMEIYNYSYSILTTLMNLTFIIVILILLYIFSTGKLKHYLPFLQIYNSKKQT